MRSIKFKLPQKTQNPWDLAVLLTESYLSSGKKSDQLLDGLPENITSENRARCQSLFLGALRHGHRARAAAKPFLRKPPKPLLEAMLLVTSYELLHESADRHPKVVHHAVERSKGLARKYEQGFINALFRKLPTALLEQETSSNLATRFSHPEWLVDHWKSGFGSEETEKLLTWNQQIPPIYLKTETTPSESLSQFLDTTQWPDFYKIINKPDWNQFIRPLLDSGCAYVKDPSTRIAPSLLKVKGGDQVLDLCAAPGGKAFEIAQRLGRNGRIVAVDLPGDRMIRLRENLDRIEGEELQTHIIEADLTEISKDDFEQRDLPTEYDAVMLDAPCSNTGVIQRRTDVKWRLSPEDIRACAKLQQQLIHSAARFVKPGGQLVYSTCSIEPEENKQLIDHFLSSKSGQKFTLKREEISLPWESGHDGASAFLLQRSSSA